MTSTTPIGQTQLALAGINSNRRTTSLLQTQIATGKEALEFRQQAGEASSILDARTVRSRTESYVSTIKDVRSRVDANDIQISGVIDNLEEVKGAIETALANREAIGLDDIFDNSFNFIANALNTNFLGSFLFSGASTGEPPVNVTTLDELAAQNGETGTDLTGADVQDAFDNSDVAFKAQISDNNTIQFGQLADEIGADIFATFQNLHNFDNGTDGPLDGQLNTTQFDFLRDKLNELNSVIDGTRQIQAENGLVAQNLDVVDQQHEDLSIFLETFISDKEDVDLAEKITDLNVAQTALEASIRVTASLLQISLLNERF